MVGGGWSGRRNGGGGGKKKGGGGGGGGDGRSFIFDLFLSLTSSTEDFEALDTKLR